MSNTSPGIRGTAAELWAAYGAAAAREGWELFHHTGRQELEIEAIDVPGEVPELAKRGITQPMFAGDDEALAHVIAQALGGSVLHALAVYLEGRNPDAECWVPASLMPHTELTGTLVDGRIVIVDGVSNTINGLKQSIPQLGHANTVEDARTAVYAITAQLTTLVDSLQDLVPPLLHEPLRIGVHIGQYNPDYTTNGGPEYPPEPRIPMTIQFEDAIRIICGVAPAADFLNAPSVLVERQTTGQWLIIVDPDGGDPICHVTITDQGAVTVEDDCGQLLLSRQHSPES